MPAGALWGARSPGLLKAFLNINEVLFACIMTVNRAAATSSHGFSISAIFKNMVEGTKSGYL